MQRSIYLLSPLVKDNTLSLPMITFSLSVDTLDVSSYDYLMFTSKQAVKSADILNPTWKKIPCLAIGEATARQIKELGGIVAYQPQSFYGQSLSLAIVERFQDKNILYIRPKKISFDSKTFLAHAGVKLKEKIVYETTCKTYLKQDKPSKNAIVIFTSPSTIHCFFKNFSWDPTYTAVVIGESTRNHLPDDVKYVVAKKPTIDACIEKAQEI